MQQYIPVHGLEWVWLIMVPPLVVSRIDRYRRVKCGEEMMGTCAEERERERVRNQLETTARVEQGRRDWGTFDDNKSLTHTTNISVSNNWSDLSSHQSLKWPVEV